MIKFETFATEEGYDTLTVNEVALSGHGLISTFFALETNEILWNADYDGVAAGWAFCIIATGETDGEGESYASGQSSGGGACTMDTECEPGRSQCYPQSDFVTVAMVARVDDHH
jgi:hypothetical protein